jgi:hypothetical protein
MTDAERQIVDRVVEALTAPDPEKQRVDTQTRKELERLVNRLKKQAASEKHDTVPITRNA